MAVQNFYSNAIYGSAVSYKFLPNDAKVWDKIVKTGSGSQKLLIKHVWLENKMKHDMTISKKRGRLTIAEYDLIRISPQKFITDTSLPKEYDTVKTIAKKIIDRSMKPHLLVRYKRIPLVSKTAPHFRVTFDSNIESCQKGDLRYNYAMYRVAPGTTIMEVKFNVFLPPWFRKVLGEFGLKREAFSKYAYGLDAVRELNPLPR